MASLFKIEFGAAVIGDDAAGLTTKLDDWGLECLVQKDPLAGSDQPALIARGNISGPFNFTSTRSYDDVDAALAAFKVELQRVGDTDTLKVTKGAVVFTYGGAICQSVRRVGPSDGVRLCINYRFETKGLT